MALYGCSQCRGAPFLEDEVTRIGDVYWCDQCYLREYGYTCVSCDDRVLSPYGKRGIPLDIRGRFVCASCKGKWEKGIIAACMYCGNFMDTKVEVFTKGDDIICKSCHKHFYPPTPDPVSMVLRVIR